MNVPPDGALSGEQPELNEEQAARLAAMLQQQQQAAAQAWRPACVNCLNNHKIAIADITQKLNSKGLQVGDPAFMQAIQQARQAGMMLAQNPMAVIGRNGAKPDIIPPIRPADVMVSGTSCCMICFMPQKQTNLLLAPGGWTPGRGT